MKIISKSFENVSNFGVDTYFVDCVFAKKLRSWFFPIPDDTEPTPKSI